ncbi:PLP-dependent aminotransferase family protein [Nocardioides sp. WV_118_6]|uniref:aminotransferase-like domain-containing protein n=1 Tax=Nocardioides simplex TaxID=2045 RepID=UPI002150164E|nr:PLP-dependent aminotransferase family protein [Pimelobacter simplex]UUW91831.1 PLP-dependent aminotransferase family protein [Pimelobacter simplex]UUW95659.1 PLP-dependent aminotransferase family protein [Pimelobacter simplex]
MLPLRLDRADPRPLGTQLADQVRHLVLDGALVGGDRMPATRRLAADLAVSRSVVEQAFDQLLAEGWLEARHGAGTWVADGTAGRPAAPPRRRPATRERDLVMLDAGTPWIDPRHEAVWRRAWREVSVATPPRGYDDARGLPELRALLAERLGRTRGVVVDADLVRITGGTGAGLRNLLAVLPSGPVAVEDPGYRAGVATVLESGRSVRDLPALDPVTDLNGCVAAYVTPAHQHPLGRVMPAADRLTLLATARRDGTLVVEDDYDSEFRYDVAPVPALASLDREQVAYLGTASKAILPSLRLGWSVVPDRLLDPYDAHRAVTHDVPPWPVQRALVTLLRDGYVDAVVRSARRVYAERAPRVVAALSPYAELAGPIAGMYSSWLLPHPAAVRARDAAEEAGFRVNLLRDYCRSATLSGLLVGFGGPTDAELDEALAVLAGALSSPAGRS